MILSEVFDAQIELAAKHKLVHILRSRPTKDIPISVGDLVKVYVKHEDEKRGKWFFLRTVLSFDRTSWTITVSSGNGETVCAVIEDVRPAVEEESFASAITKPNDQFEGRLDAALLNKKKPSSERRRKR